MTALRWLARTVAPHHRLAKAPGSRRPYYAAPELGLHGRTTIAIRLAGLHPVVSLLRGRHVLDLGCAEGVVLQEMLKGGPASGHGVDNSAERIASAKRLHIDPRLHFDVVDLNRTTCFDAPVFRQGYDVVLMLGVYQHLAAASRPIVLRRALERCRERFVLRIPRCHIERIDPSEIVRNAGFAVEQAIEPERGEPVTIYKRVAP
ncbi:class I SAM-dependent methyltransferase [Marinivivus vitaminiproducens]|uniref:class I SAM-dependent methyltransferase n=1 Tax=Marinivivus vitaminiproducens TaxID=3035935 RepID=UPI00279CB0F4|nr:class I SAM-dependent methyltransferase [Geminicoccaceae bacterium SCSIO 64248]